ncbi:putative ribosome assembly protein 3 [Cadophora sp. MPI-SDFR-AT-0126]|nr:putative ribosome assembly protein 3 [Leotiomycetes sp. MPI-SDFR-AT-0126]
MVTKTNAKPKRHKKRKSRTEVSSDSESERSSKQVKSKASRSEDVKGSLSSSTEEIATRKKEPSSKGLEAADIEVAFSKFYMQRVTAEFADDLERLRTSDDFKDEAVPMLIAALKGGTAMFSEEEKKRIMLAGSGKHF